MYEILAKPSGRVLKYDVASNSSEVIMDELSFANGIVLSPGEDFFLVRLPSQILETKFCSTPCKARPT
jgi:sugar lactone lactonase YvrE